jgi:hypothetical protein
MNGTAFFLHALTATEINEIRIENNNVFCRFSFKGVQPETVYIQLYMSSRENFGSESAELVLSNLRMIRNGDMYSGPLRTESPLPFKPGEQIFFSACAGPLYGADLTLYNQWYITGIDTYFDYENNQFVYPALGKESAQNSFIMP